MHPTLFKNILKIQSSLDSYLKTSVCPSSADNRRGVYPCLSNMFTFAPLSMRTVTTASRFCLTAETRAEPSTSSLRVPLALSVV